MASPEEGAEASPAASVLTYRFASATYRDKKYSRGVFILDVPRMEIELRQSTRKMWRKVETVIARFRVESTAEVKLEGALLKVSDLALVLESPGAAGEVAELLARPAEERRRAKFLSEAESALGEFLGKREEAMSLLARVRKEPREALLSVRSMWPEDDAGEPIDAIFSGYTNTLTESLQSMRASLDESEKVLGSRLGGRLYALAYTVGAVQDALFKTDSDLAEELAALQELGVSMTAEDLRMEKPTERMLLRAHPALQSLSALGSR